MTDEIIHCDQHGDRTAVMSCVHIGHQTCHRIYINPADDEYPEQAWCSICEQARIKDQGWFDYADAVADWRWICRTCLLNAIVLAVECVRVGNPGVPDER